MAVQFRLNHFQERFCIFEITALSKINKSQKDIIIFSNHQLQYITGELSDKSIFNMWMGDYGITEIADIISYIDKFDNSLFPNKY